MFWLFAGADVNHGNSQFITPLCAAAAKNDIFLVNLLLDNKCDVNKLTDSRPLACVKTPLHFAIIHRNVTMVKDLLKAGHDVNFPTYGDLHPFEVAMMSHKQEILRTILRHPYFEYRIQDESWRHPLANNLFPLKDLAMTAELLDCAKIPVVLDGRTFLELILMRDPCSQSKEIIAKITRLLLLATVDCLHENKSVYKGWLEADPVVGMFESRMTTIDQLLKAGLIPSHHELQIMHKLCKTNSEYSAIKNIQQLCSVPLSLEKLAQRRVRYCMGLRCYRRVHHLPIPRMLQQYVATNCMNHKPCKTYHGELVENLNA